MDIVYFAQALVKIGTVMELSVLQEIKEDILEYCRSLNLDSVGFTKCRRFDELIEFLQYRKNNGLFNEFEEQDIEKKINPNLYMEDGKTIISIAFPYIFLEKDNKEIYFSKYTRTKDYHKVVKLYLDKVCEYIIEKGGKAISFVDSNCLQERYIASLSGVGFIGKNNMLITKKYGSYVFLGEIITNLDMVIEENKGYNPMNIEFKECGQCNMCYEKCPTKAINKGRKNSNICLSYITQKKDLEDKWIKQINGRLFGCDTCQDCCPYNKGIDQSNINEFKEIHYMDEVNIEELIYLDKKTFREKYMLTSCGWRGKAVLQRNAILAKVLKLGESNINIKEITSPYVREYYNKALERLKRNGES